MKTILFIAFLSTMAILCMAAEQGQQSQGTVGGSPTPNQQPSGSMGTETTTPPPSGSSALLFSPYVHLLCKHNPESGIFRIRYRNRTGPEHILPLSTGTGPDRIISAPDRTGQELIHDRKN
ncbi:unnamed protein product [Medioppia subpectinata]|uniref:Uncharacterized protein n=1 Tax=Medioppia subpectinata TaxID=1979941 RepID=A0A7R9KJX6_9ACAR|nr:unnamed protein product [Medioppia subpectinata]CAG2103556.1 unnamed protein product [Medioppia subpectinata]